MADNSIQSSSPSLPLVTRLKLLMFQFSRRTDGTINPHLFNLLHFKTSAPATKRINAIHVTTSDITIDLSRNLWFRLFIPTTTDSNANNHSEKLILPLIVYFHGGGFTHYGPDSKVFDNLCSHLAAGGPAVVASVNYRLTPEHKYPSQYEDSFDALKFIDAQYSHILPANTDLSKCFIGGDSAGGNIAHHVTIRALEKADQFGKIRIIGILGLQPFFGGEERTESELRLTKAPVLSLNRTDACWRDFLPVGTNRNHPAAHVFGDGPNSEAAAALRNLDFPPALVIVGGNDPLQDWDRKYAGWLQNCGKRVVLVDYPNAFHAFYAFPELPEFALLIDDVANFVREQVYSK